MNFSPKQGQAIKLVNDWYKSGDQQVFYLAGYAGTGKTTLAKEFASGVSGQVYFAAYTGKASYVLRQKGCPATTIHQLIYNPRSKSKVKLLELEQRLKELREKLEANGYHEEDREHHADVLYIKREIEEESSALHKPLFELNLDSCLKDPSCSLIVVDECSMIDERMGQDLLSFDKKILVLGDPAQLPPIRGAGFFTSRDPDFLLTEIHRQAQGDPILEMATRVREGRGLIAGQYGTSRVLLKSEFCKDHVLEADQVLVGRNETRTAFNRRYREIIGRQTLLPEVGDKVVCLRNNHDIGLLNGGLWEVEESHTDEDSEFVLMTITDEETRTEITAHRAIFLNEKLEWWQKKEAEEFDFGYALTCHKSQGSQWPKVMIYDESSAFGVNRNKWLYTALTRASESVTVII